MTGITTALDAAMQQHPAQLAADKDAGRLAFLHLLADTPLLILLEREAQGEVLEPRIFDLDEGQVVLAFDTEERLAAMGEGPQPYAELPGRVLARLLVSEGLGLGLNLGAGTASEMLLPVSAMVWLDEMLAKLPDVQMGGFGPLAPPDADLVTIIRRLLQNAPQSWGGLAQGVRIYARQDSALVVIEGAEPDAETALATALSEAFRFADLGERVVDIAFAEGRILPEGGISIAWPERKASPSEDAADRPGPGTQADKPPILR